MIKGLLYILLSLLTQHQLPVPMENERTIVLIRHAKSSWDNPDLADFDRPLNDRGFTDAPLMGKQLALQGLHFDAVIASPSKRTTQTLSFLLKELKFPESKIIWDSSIFHSSSDNLLRILRDLDASVKTVALVGHNPSMTDLANYLQSDTMIENVPTCGIVCVSAELPTWNDLQRQKAKLEFFIYPKAISK